MAVEPQTQGSQDDYDQTALVNGLTRLKKIRDDEEKQVKKVKQDEEILPEQKEQIKGEGNVVGTQEISEELREKREAQVDEVWLEFEDYTRSWDPAKKIVDNLAEKILQLNQSDTKTKNREDDWKDLTTPAEEFGWSKDVEMSML